MAEVPDRIEFGLRAERREHVCVWFVDVESRVFPSALIEIIPIEANLEQRTIDYQKGCYIGQEVISRMKMSGQTNKRLCGLISLRGLPLQPGLRLATPSNAGKEVGWITSATRSENQEIALGYVKRGFNNVGTKLAATSPSAARSDVPTAGDSASKESQLIPVDVVPLPFV